MAYSFLIFDFGSNEEAAQQARHKVEGWKQAFRLGNKILLKFEREENESEPGDARGSDAKAKKPAKKESEKPEPGSRIRLLIRLDFSDHEKLSHQRWLDRIPAEEAFKPAKSETVRAGEPRFATTSEHFESLD